MRILAIMGALALATPAEAQTMADVYTWEAALHGVKPYVKIDEPEVSAAVATVTFQDVSVHGEDTSFVLHGDIPVAIEFDWHAGGGDTVRVTPPAGYVAIPTEITPGEGQMGKSHIYLYLGG